MNTQSRTIADLAYALWEARGRPLGSAHLDWSEAERQVMARRPTAYSGVDAPQSPNPPIRSADAPFNSANGSFNWAHAPLDSKIDESELASFPASDPPSSHLPDEPASNAAAKWEGAGIERKSTAGMDDSG